MPSTRPWKRICCDGCGRSGREPRARCPPRANSRSPASRRPSPATRARKRPAAERRFRFFAGKGGVGKTTCAAAAAVLAAERGRRVLLVSTDPAHSLGDVLRRRLAATPHRVSGVHGGRLDAVELDADAALGRWLRRRRHALAAIAERGTYLDEEDVGRLLRLSLPGVDELVGLVELERLAHTSPAELVVVDTAPTGHTLRLLAMPDTLARVAAVLDAMHAKHRFLAQSLGGAYRPDASDALIAELEEAASELSALLRDPARATFTWLLVPEPLALAEARDGVAALDAAGLHVAEIVVNRITPPGRPPCPWCAERRRAEAAVLSETRAAFPERSVRLVPATHREPVGLPALRTVARHLTDRVRRAGALRVVPVRAERRSTVVVSAAWLDAIVPRGCRLVVVVGKGGVGKTTCAAAIALALAGREATRVLLLSADPAHSIGDVLAAPVADTPTRVANAPPSLHAREMDAAAALVERRERYRAGVETLFRRLQGNSRFEPVFDRAVIDNLIDLAPPGIDELFAILSIIEALLPSSGVPPYDAVVLDTAPTGHALRLLALPSAALEWVRALLTILLKYRAVTGLGTLASDLVGLSKSLRALRALLGEQTRTRAIVVTRAGEVPLAETVRLLAALRRLRIAVGTVIVNAVAPARCPHCRAGESEARVLRALRRRAPRLLAAPALATPPRGPASLMRWATTWRPIGG